MITVCIDVWAHVRMDGLGGLVAKWMDVWVNGCIDALMHGCVHGFMHERMHGEVH